MMRRLGFAAVSVTVTLMVAGWGSGHSRRLPGGVWYSKIVAVNIAHRTLTVAPACRLNEGRWIAVAGSSRAPTAIAVSPYADLKVYYRPSGDAARGHQQSADLLYLADVAMHGHLPDLPAGWFVTVRDHAAVSVQEDSGVRSSGNADKRTFACAWSTSTQAFVSH